MLQAASWRLLKRCMSISHALHHLQGCSVCEEQQCDFTVGYGGSPDEAGHTTLDAMLMDGVGQSGVRLQHDVRLPTPDCNGTTCIHRKAVSGTHLQGSMAAGAVAALQATRQAATAARLVMQHSSHTLLAGPAADAFAREMGLPAANLSTPLTAAQHRSWLVDLYGHLRAGMRSTPHPRFSSQRQMHRRWHADVQAAGTLPAKLQTECGA
jgi:N4-(beta-N-acetylglucosaminyl)-L-asparaginase